MPPVGFRVFVIAPAAMLTDHRAHGDGLVAYGFIRELAARGHELHVAAGRVDLRTGPPPQVHVYPLGGEAGPRRRFMWRVRGLYRQLSRSAGFDLVHQLTPVEVGVSLALADTGVPLVLGPYVPDWAPSGKGADLEVGPATLRIKRVVRAAQQTRATAILLSNPAATPKLELRARPWPHVRELPLGVDERTWVPGDGGGRGQDVLFLANLEVRKGIHVALDAFARLAPELPAARLIVAGAGPELDQVRRRIRGAPALSRVDLLGHVERDRVLATVQACDVYCLPSYGDPNPLAVLEAMACARPVVATDAGGLRYLVPDGGGRKVPPGDAAALAAALRELLADPALRRGMGEHNRRVVEERYAWSRVVDRLEDVYQYAVRNPRARLSRARSASAP
jgi:glycosyltransferase involved in cell wall biosynthesis